MASTLVVKKVFPATVLIATEDKNGQLQSLGSGFLVSANVIATNFHVIENSHAGYVKLVNKDGVYEIDGVVGYSIEYDLALIKIGDNSGTPLTLKSPSVDIGQKIFAIGNPLGLEGTISDGIISGLRDYEGLSLLQISAPISPGNSGGPVVDENGEVIGVATYTFSEGQNLNFAVPVKYLKELFNNQTSLVSLASLVRTDSTPSKQTSMDYKGAAIEKLLINGCHWMYIDRYGYDCELQFSLKNNLRQAIHSIQTILIIYDIDDEVLDYQNRVFYNHSDGSTYCIKSKLASRVTSGLPKDSIGYLYKTGVVPHNNLQDILKYIEFRILDFEICG